MPLQSPKLDDRTFEQLLAEARRLIAQKATDWTDLSPGDPGIVLLELFAYLTEVMLYRLNRLPEKAYIEFLRLLGVRLQPPSAASVALTFSRGAKAAQALEIPRGTRVTTGRAGSGTEPPVFITANPAVIPPNETETTVLAYNCEQVEAERVGTGTGQPGQLATVARPPIIAPTGDALDLVVAVEARPEELDERLPAIQHNGRTYRIWREVEHFTDLGDEDHVFLADRQSGQITFAPAVQMRAASGELAERPALLAAVPPANRAIHVWYRRGGGPEGNLAEERLTTLKDPIPGVKVTNRGRATGGKAAESLPNALLRGPQELHSLQRAVTARDFELIARNYSARAVARARAFTRASLWRHALPGHVEVLLVPEVPPEAGDVLSRDVLHAYQAEPARSQIQAALDERKPLGTTCLVNWARYKQVWVRARIVVQREEDQAALQRRLLQRLNGTLTPLPTEFNSTGWPFGQALRASHVYDIALAEPGVRWVDWVRLLVEETPNQSVAAVAVDHFQPGTWYVGSGEVLFRSLNDGDGWEPVGRFAGPVAAVEAHGQRAGLVAVGCRLPDGLGSRVHISADCGETWQAGDLGLAFDLNSLAWTMRGDTPVLFLATDVGLYEIALQADASPLQILVNPAEQERGFHAVAAYTDLRGVTSVAVAAQGLGGVYLSSAGGRSNSFRQIPRNLRAQEDIRVLEVQDDGTRGFLWAGAAATEGGVGTGCHRWELRGTADPPEGWEAFGAGWEAGSCKGLAFQGDRVYAATHRLGVLTLEAAKENARWVAPGINCGLPLREREQQRLFYPVDAIAASPDPETPLVMAGGREGVHRTADAGVSYQPASSREFIEKVTLPETWLFVSGAHAIEIVSEDEAQ